MAKKVKPTVVSFLLDETGSMGSIKGETIAGFNSYIDTLSGEKKANISFTLVKFNSSKTEHVCVGVPVKDVPKLTNENYTPAAVTPLIDASYKIITATQEHVEKRDDKPNVVVVIQTDGYENASTKHSLQDLAKLVKDLTADGWQFVFLGADMDAFAQASAMGFATANTTNYAGRNTAETFSVMGAKSVAYAATGEAASLRFTNEERDRMGGAKPEQQRTRGSTTAPQKDSLADDISLEQ